MAQASSAWHQGNGDIVRFTPEHVASTKTRAQVNAELNAVIANGTLRYYQWSVPVPAKATAQSVTRQQVIEDMLNQTPKQQRAERVACGGFHRHACGRHAGSDGQSDFHEVAQGGQWPNP
ncbi:DUF4148 domain-containing protein [Ottowia thiooxydans]|uniref:DUF4148 domain-containing protein n=1 Tax=Ottowia thiooxydans TaxID=219182 RepID=UPI0033937E95